MINSHNLLGLPILQITYRFHVLQLRFLIHSIKPKHCLWQIHAANEQYEGAVCGCMMKRDPGKSEGWEITYHMKLNKSSAGFWDWAALDKCTDWETRGRKAVLQMRKFWLTAS